MAGRHARGDANAGRPSRLTRGLVLLAAGAAVAVLALVLPSDGASAGDGTAAATGSTGTTTLTLVTACSGCRFSLTSSTDRADTVWHTRFRRATDGEVTFTVPTSRTVGLTIAVRAPWVTQQQFVSLVALRYADDDAGDAVPASAARGGKRAFGCWAGTSSDSARLRVAVRRRTVATPDGDALAVLAWARTARPTLAPGYRTTDGVLGAQGTTTCEAPVAA
ncbi:hypothetical protein [Nocardioides sp. GY 10127]|uniref:hypothetical protein n=1 Tax=Nocardioides sp. GY 10127 TaxID=2569762 RepID=UPI0010A7AC1D|nr:hypothetical protein [Nocardioides sp. GY 10127]TIC85666.1 hypothetical protein E8D37_03390 [Nocardioides sp. GY 10127]